MRKKYNSVLHERQKAAIVIQSHVRGHLARRTKTQLDLRQKSAIKIQRGNLC